MAELAKTALSVLRKTLFALPVLALALTLELSITRPYANTTESFEVYYARPKLLLGDVYAMTVKTPSTASVLRGTFLNENIEFFATAPGEYASLIPATFDTPTGIQLLKITQDDGGRTKTFYYPLVVNIKFFKNTEFTVPKNMAFPGKAAQERIAEEKALVLKIKNERSSGASMTQKLWNGAFMMPVGGRVTDPFGAQRTVNKKLKYNHNGIDLRAKTGTRVLASNSGEVIIARDFYITGNTVIIDHGLGLFTTYAHLSKLKVKEGDKIEKGRLVGLAGATGRVTGSHLHWGASLNGYFVNPLSLVRATKAIAQHTVTTAPITIE